MSRLDEIKQRAQTNQYTDSITKDIPYLLELIERAKESLNEILSGTTGELIEGWDKAEALLKEIGE